MCTQVGRFLNNEEDDDDEKLSQANVIVKVSAYSLAFLPFLLSISRVDRSAHQHQARVKLNKTSIYVNVTERDFLLRGKIALIIVSTIEGITLIKGFYNPTCVQTIYVK